MAERSEKLSDDPLNLMRVMPPQGARSVHGHAFSRAWLFLFNERGLISPNQLK